MEPMSEPADNLDDVSRFYQGKRIVVTGGAGFLGSFVVDALKRFEPSAIDIPRSTTCDLRDASQTAQFLEATKPDLIFHLAAAVGGIGANQAKPGTFFRDNMLMGLNVIEQARRLNIPKVVIAGTVCAYPKFTPVPFREEDLWNGYPEETNAPYGVAKKALLVMAQAYRQEFGSNDIMVFPVNLYGPRDNFDLNTSHVIPAMIRKFHEAKKNQTKEVVLWGDGSPTREFLYVEDAAHALVLAGARYNASDPINVGAGREISIRDLATLTANILGYEGALRWDTSKPNGQPRRMLETSKAKALFGFSARVSLEDGLKQTIDWYLNNPLN